MEHLHITERPGLRKPVWIGAFAGFTDAQEGATRAIRYLAHHLRATKFASIDAEEFYDFTSVRPIVYNNAQGQRMIRWPTNDFYYWSDPAGARDVILFLGSEPSLRWRTYIALLHKIMAPYEMDSAVTLGSLLAAAPHTRDAPLSAMVTREDLQSRLGELRASESTYQGPVGINAVFVESCKERGLGHINIWGHAAHYVERLPNHKVTYALVKQVNASLGLNLPLQPLFHQAAAFESEATKMVAASVELSTYVKRLEQQFDGQMAARQEQQAPGPTVPELPRVFAEEIDRLLKSKEPDEGPAAS
jgi:proteasome assembly chaperone (PAC2) family protein